MVPTPFLRSLRTARSVAVAGIIFAVTLTATLYLFRASFPLNSVVGPETTLAAEDISRGRIALFLLPYVGISFLWFMGALNYSLGHADNRLFTTVFLSSGILFIGLSFVAGSLRRTRSLNPRPRPCSGDSRARESPSGPRLASSS